MSPSGLTACFVRIFLCHACLVGRLCCTCNMPPLLFFPTFFSTNQTHQIHSPQAEKLLDRGIHPVRIGEGFDRACQAAVKHLETIADAVEFSKDNTEVSGSIDREVRSSWVVNRSACVSTRQLVYKPYRLLVSLSVPPPPTRRCVSPLFSAPRL